MSQCNAPELISLHVLSKLERLCPSVRNSACELSGYETYGVGQQHRCSHLDDRCMISIHRPAKKQQTPSSFVCCRSAERVGCGRVLWFEQKQSFNAPYACLRIEDLLRNCDHARLHHSRIWSSRSGLGGISSTKRRDVP